MAGAWQEHGELLRAHARPTAGPVGQQCDDGDGDTDDGDSVQAARGPRARVTVSLGDRQWSLQ